MADDPSNPPSGSTLDQSEIDKLLAQEVAVAPPKQFLIRPDGARADGTGPLKVEAYDFRNPAFLSEIELRRLRLLHEDFIRYLSARLSLYLRMEFSLKMARLTTASYSKFTESLPNPTHLCLFKVEPLVGVGILDINPRLALTIADRLLGGRGHSVKTERYLTEIEIALLEDVIAIVLEEWSSQWKTEEELHPLIIGYENNGRFLQTSPKDAIVLILTLEANFGDCAEQIQIGVPQLGQAAQGTGGRRQDGRQRGRGENRLGVPLVEQILGGVPGPQNNRLRLNRPQLRPELLRQQRREHLLVRQEPLEGQHLRLLGVHHGVGGVVKEAAPIEHRLREQ